MLVIHFIVLRVFFDDESTVDKKVLELELNL